MWFVRETRVLYLLAGSVFYSFMGVGGGGGERWREGERSGVPSFSFSCVFAPPQNG
jgi:hypothetical protein